MELWKYKLAELKNNDIADEVSILGEDVTGVRSNNDGPDNLFYSEFSESDAKSFFDIFNRFKESITTNQFAVDSLEVNLKTQLRAVTKGVNPVEVVLYSSRSIKEQLYSNSKIIKVLKSIVIPNLRYPDNTKIVWHILAGWEWLSPICVLIESIGDTNNDELVELAMKSYPRLANMARETNERYIFTSYLNMVFATQNPAFNKYIIDIVTNKNFVQDNDLTDAFLKKISKIGYLNAEPIYSSLLTDISAKSGTPAPFRIKIDNVLKARHQKELLDGTTDEKKLNVTSLRFGAASRKDINAIKNIRDADSIVEALKAVMNNIDNIWPEEQKGDAYILLGTKGMSIRNEIISFLNSELEHNTEYKVPIYLALQELREIGMNEVLSSILTENYRLCWVKSVANYCRFRTRFLGEWLVPKFTSEIIANPSDETIIKRYLKILYNILDVYNAGVGKLNSDNVLPGAIINMMNALNATFKDTEIYESMIYILHLLSKACPSKKRKILNQLYIMKENLKNQDNCKIIEDRVNKLIKSMESIVAPK